MATLHHLNTHRCIPLKTLDQISRENEGQHKPDLVELLRERCKPSLFERIGDALGSRDFFLIYIGIYIGAMLTVGFAFLWSLS